MDLLKHVLTKLLFMLALIIVLYAKENVKKIGNKAHATKHTNETTAQVFPIDLPLKEDLKYFIVSLQKMIEYCESVRSEGSLSLGFGLFFLTVNLRVVLRYKHDLLPKSGQLQLGELIKSAQVEIAAIVTKFKETPGQGSVWHRFNLMVLDGHSSAWVERLHPDVKPLPLVLRKYRPIDYNTTKPKIGRGAACGKSIIEKIKWEMEEPICAPNKACYNFLINDQDKGQMIVRRIMVLVIARVGRGCSMFSFTKDKELTARLCSIGYGEAWRIFQMSDSELIGIVIEYIALCLFAGHSEFHRRDFYNKILKHQQWQGCFGFRKPKRQNLLQSASSLRRMWALTFAEGHINSECNHDITAVAAAALAAGVRFILNGEVK